MWSNHIGLYALVEGNNGRNHEELQPYEQNAGIRAMSETHTAAADHYEPGLYEIRIQGHLDANWTDWFDSLTLTLEDNGITLLAARVVDQAALHSLLRKVRDLGMPLISVIRIEAGHADTLVVEH
jgi:hypothetical protein